MKKSKALNSNRTLNGIDHRLYHSDASFVEEKHARLKLAQHLKYNQLSKSIKMSFKMRLKRRY